MAFCCRAGDGPLLVVFGSYLPLSTKKKYQSLTPCDKTFLIRTSYLKSCWCNMQTINPFVVCSSFLFLSSLYCKQYGPRSDCSLGSSLIRGHTICFLDKSSLIRLVWSTATKNKGTYLCAGKMFWSSLRLLDQVSFNKLILHCILLHGPK